MSGRGNGRGAYYKAKYGGGGRGGGRGGGGRGGVKRGPADDDTSSFGRGATPATAQPSSQLAAILQRIDSRQYPCYHDIEGVWDFPAFRLIIERAQADPYASPTRCKVQVPAETAGLPEALSASKIRRTAVCDYLTRQFGSAIAASGGDVRRQAGGWGGEKGGEMTVDMPGQHVLERTSVLLNQQGDAEARFTIALPAKGRTVLGQWAATIIVQNLPRYVAAGLVYAQQDAGRLKQHVQCVEDTQALRDALSSQSLVAFVANGAILPRASGASDLPMQKAVPFKSPASLEVEVELPNGGRVRGMGVRKGVTLIVGGGYNGKSTLLEALELGIYNKVPGDGRELVATDPSAVKIRAEDGRRVAGVNISPFINDLPFGRDTRNFSTEDASGSTSQAANIQEALELGATTLLLDEDTCASNFMHRDDKMAALVQKDPITPFSAKIRPLAASGVSCILVNGASGDFFGSADTVICMDSFAAKDVTCEAHAISQRGSGPPAVAEYGGVTQRAPASLLGSQGGNVKVSTRSKGLISLGDENVDISAVEQLVEQSQTRGIAAALMLIHRQLQLRHGLTLSAILESIQQQIEGEQGLDALAAGKGDVARPRKLEMAAALNRVRSLTVRQVSM